MPLSRALFKVAPSHELGTSTHEHSIFLTHSLLDSLTARVLHFLLHLHQYTQGASYQG